MTDGRIDQIHKALWETERIYGPRSVDLFACSSFTQDVLLAAAADTSVLRFLLTEQKLEVTLFGLPIELDASLPVGEIQIKGNGQMIRVVNLNPK